MKRDIRLAVLILNSSKQVLLGLRSDRNEKEWTIAELDVVPSKSLASSAFIGVEEQTGIYPDHILPIGLYDNPSSTDKLFALYALLNFRAEPIPLQNVSEWKWFSIEDLPNELSVIAIEALKLWKKLDKSKDSDNYQVTEEM